MVQLNYMIMREPFAAHNGNKEAFLPSSCSSCKVKDKKKKKPSWVACPCSTNWSLGSHPSVHQGATHSRNRTGLKPLQHFSTAKAVFLKSVTPKQAQCKGTFSVTLTSSATAVLNWKNAEEVPHKQWHAEMILPQSLIVLASSDNYSH